MQPIRCSQDAAALGVDFDKHMSNTKTAGVRTGGTVTGATTATRARTGPGTGGITPINVTIKTKVRKGLQKSKTNRG